MHHKPARQPGLEPVHIEFSAPAATTVGIAASFNDWQPEATPMISIGAGHWSRGLVLRPGVYEYLFVADGRWTPDPHARAAAPNPFGGMNSVLKVNSRVREEARQHIAEGQVP